jgi:hypothetical protein
MIKKAISIIKTIGVTYNKEDVLVVLEKGTNALKLIKLMDLAFDGKFPYQTVILETFPQSNDKPTAFICDECKNKFKTESALKAHYTRSHKGIPIPKVFAAVSKPTSDIEKLEAFKKYLVENPKKCLILQRTDDLIFLSDQKDIRPLQYLEEEDNL